MEDIFISYKDERRPAVAYFAEILRAHGFSVWFDYGVLHSKNFGNHVEKKLRAAKVVLVLWCPLSVRSNWVHHEAALAKELGIFYPVRLAKCDLPIGFQDDPFIDLSNWDGDPRSTALNNLIQKLNEVLTCEEAAIPRQSLDGLEQYWQAQGRPSMLTFEKSVPLDLPADDRQMPSTKKTEPAETDTQSADGFPAEDSTHAHESGQSLEPAASPTLSFGGETMLTQLPEPPTSPPRAASPSTTPTLEEEYETIKDSPRLEDWASFVDKHRESNSALLIGARAKIRHMKKQNEASRAAAEAARREAEAAVAAANLEKEAAEVWRLIDGIDDRQALVEFFEHFSKTDACYEAAIKLAKKGMPVAQTGNGKQNTNLRILELGEKFKDADFAPEMVVLPAGEFRMGEGSDVKNVTIEKPFAVARYPTTFAEWDAAYSAGGVQHKPGDQGWGRGQRPVIHVSWCDAREYAEWLSKETGKPYRLLSEAEWEYACRAGTTTRYSFGDTITKQQARYLEGKRGSSGHTVEVGSFPPNDWGLYDMHGNVWEWCEDKHDNSSRILRGGSWFTSPGFLRASHRKYDRPGERDYDVGFRLARMLLPQTC